MDPSTSLLSMTARMRLSLATSLKERVIDFCDCFGRFVPDCWLVAMASSSERCRLGAASVFTSAGGGALPVPAIWALAHWSESFCSLVSSLDVLDPIAARFDGFLCRVVVWLPDLAGGGTDPGQEDSITEPGGTEGTWDPAGRDDLADPFPTGPEAGFSTGLTVWAEAALEEPAEKY
ncbi:hypothetical protein FF38_03289 [Lucilia cuprina]|uniref:Uncharacterized protein n=1 Tax=Lucilia cuprina TaxID=7375 RepID=A0A0L0BW09_LUCCU|nr:hypothetical protein FF38_03289 [Lucilia cuprina]